MSDTVTVAKGGTGATSLTDGGILLGSGSGAVTAMAVLADGEMIVGDGTTDPVAESGSTLRASIGVDAAGTDNSTDVTLANTNYLSISGQAITGGTVPVGSGGTGATSAGAARTALGLAYASDAEALAGSIDTVVLTPGNLAARSYRETVGNGSLTTINIDHNLGTRDVMVQLYDASSHETVYAQVVRSTTNRVVLTFNVAPTNDDVIALVTKID